MKNNLNFAAVHYTIIIGRNWIYHAELCEEIDKLFITDGCFRILSGYQAVGRGAAESSFPKLYKAPCKYCYHSWGIFLSGCAGQEAPGVSPVWLTG